MIVGVNCGHTKMGTGCGANEIMNESVYTRKAGYALMEILRNSGAIVIDRMVDKASPRYSISDQLPGRIRKSEKS